jgi:putative peptide zinc metalloprotease protein
VTTASTRDLERRAEGAPSGRAVPRLAAGVELVGQYADSGFKDPPWIARLGDGRVVQMPALLFHVAEEIDGTRNTGEIAERVTAKVKRGLAAEDVEFLVAERLGPLGVVAAPDGSTPRTKKLDPLLALRFRVALVPARVTRVLTTLLLPFFFPPVLLVALAAIAAVEFWLFFVHGIAQSTRELLYNPVLLVLVFALVVVATALHELGHATAVRYGGARPGVIGAGVYIVWPAFYTDVTDAYRLNRLGRLRVDFGGVYFNGLFVLLVAGAYWLTGFEPLLVLVLIQNIQVVQQFLPFLRLDGYYILSDLTGVPDMFSRIKPTLRSLVPGREPAPEVHELKPWVRVVTTAWVLALVPVLLLMFGTMIFNFPRLAATAWDSLFVQLEKVTGGSGFEIAAGAIQTSALVLPLAGFTYTFARVSHRLGAAAWSWSTDAPFRRSLVVGIAVTTAAVAGYVLLPNGDYRPVQPGERGTLPGALDQFEAIATGRPGLTEEREQELGGAPFLSERLAGDVGEAPEDGGGARPPAGVGSSSRRDTPTATQPPGSTTAQTGGGAAPTTGAPSATVSTPVATATVQTPQLPVPPPAPVPTVPTVSVPDTPTVTLPVNPPPVTLPTTTLPPVPVPPPTTTVPPLPPVPP